MAKRIENECAYCAEEIELEKHIVGKDWKVYCCRPCAEAGETISSDEWRHLMRLVTGRHGFIVREQTT